MTPNERSLITELFARIRGTQVAARDPEAERFIEAEMSRSPGAAYALAQTVLVQDQALREAHERLSSLQAAGEQPEERAEAASPWARPGSLAERIGLTRRGAVPRAGVSPADAEQAPEPARGGGFLQGALQTAAGVAGGALLFEGVKSLFGGGESSSGLFGSGAGGDAKAGLSDDELTRSGLAPAAYDADNPDPDGDDPDTSDDWTDDGFDGDSDTI